MPAKTPRTPSYRLHKATGLAVVTLNGRDIYLGRYGSLESKAEYDRLIGEWLIRGRGEPAQSVADGGPTVDAVAVAFWRHALEHYRGPTGLPSGELENLRAAIKPLRALYGPSPAGDFGPLALRAVRARMVDSGLARTTVNARVNRIRRVFKWAVSVEMIPPRVLQALQAVEPLEKGRSGVRESDEVTPVAVERVEAVLPYLSRPVAAMVRLQLLTGCRAGEVMAMRGGDLTPGEPNWEYRPASHKNAWRGTARVIPIGPQARAILADFVRDDAAAYLFDPREAAAARRKPPRPPGARPTGARPARRRRGKSAPRPAARYDRRAYRQAVARGCDRAFPHPREAELLSAVRAEGLTAEERRARRETLERWRRANREELVAWRRRQRWSPLRLRHTAATLIRARYGLEAASNVLGHARPDTTLIYAERDLARAHSIAAEIG